MDTTGSGSVSSDGMLAIAAFRKDGSSPWPGMDWFATKLAAMLEGEMGLWLVYSTTPPAPPAPPLAKKWKVATSACNIRSSPTAPADNIIGTAKNGDIFTEIGEALGWVEVATNQWISLSVLTAA